MAPPENLDALNFSRTTVVRDIQHCFCLNHGWLDSGSSHVDALQRPRFGL